ncbi:MAG: hypothetical protein ACUVRG_04155 [Ignavibacterium sp.]
MNKQTNKVASEGYMVYIRSFLYHPEDWLEFLKMFWSGIIFNHS